ncbi:hypothetical protein [Bradyrhizobium macuxiense]|nr:hypothetical protein [Bradyrhizobium macuxiense]
MLADPRTSRVVLVNPARVLSAGETCERARKARESLRLLAACHEWFAVRAFAIGDLGSTAFDPSICRLSSDTLDLWTDTEFIGDIDASQGCCVLLGGGWIDEDILMLALQGAWLGYDVRLLIDLSCQRSEGDEALVIKRLVLHGIIPTTVRQTVLEWSVQIGDRDLRQLVRQFLG